jgi:hypothetical protein
MIRSASSAGTAQLKAVAPRDQVPAGWSSEEERVAIGLLDGLGLLRLAIMPDAHRSEDLARHLVNDAVHPGRGVLPPGAASGEAPPAWLVHDLLGQAGWGRRRTIVADAS